MMNRVRFSIASVVLAAGCASAPIKLYTLSPPLPDAPATPRDALVVQLPPAHMPAQVDRREIVVRKNGDQLTLLENEQWASTPGDQISSGVLLELKRRLDLSDAHERQHITALSLAIDVERFEAVMDRYDVLSATWSAEIHQDTGIIKLACPFSASPAIDPGVSAVVIGYQQAVKALGEQVAQAVLTSLMQRKAVCQVLGARDVIDGLEGAVRAVAKA